MSDALLRVSEVAALDTADIARDADGSATVTVRRSKTDQEGEGAVLYLGAPTVRRLEHLARGRRDHARDRCFARSAKSEKRRDEGGSRPAASDGSSPPAPTTSASKAPADTRSESAPPRASYAPAQNYPKRCSPAAGNPPQWSAATPAQNSPAAAPSPASATAANPHDPRRLTAQTGSQGLAVSRDALWSLSRV